MGGRGGGSGGGNKSAAGSKMPTLTGSERQVKWANEIRANTLSAADAVIRNAKKYQKLGLKPSTTTPSVEGANFARKSVIDSFKAMTSASKIIDSRKSLTQRNIENIALEYDRRRRRR